MTFLGVWFPIAVRKAQKLARKKNDRFLDWGRLCLALDLPPSDRQALIHKLDQLAQTRGPGFLIEGPKPVNLSDQSDSSNLSIKEDEREAGANSSSLAPEEGGIESPGPKEGGKGGDLTDSAQTDSQPETKDEGGRDSEQAVLSDLSKEEERKTGANPPSAAPEEGGVENSGPKGGGKGGELDLDSAQTDSRQEESQSQAEISADLGRDTPGEGATPEASDTPDPSRPETGTTTSGGWVHGETAQTSHPRAEIPPSTALGGEDVSRRLEGPFSQEDCPRDGVFFQRLPEDEQPEESPPQKKWDNQAKGKPSDESSDKPGGITAKIEKLSVDRALVREVRQRLSRLVGESSEDFGPRRDFPDLCVRLKTFQKLPPARREERGRPAILVLADVSVSCTSFSQKAVAVAKAAGAVGVPGTDVVSVTHSNGRPSEVLHNQTFILPDTIGSLPAGGNEDCDLHPWYSALQRRFSFQVVIALGDWHAVSVYVLFLLDPDVQKLIWLDGARAVRGSVKNQSAMALKLIQRRCPLSPQGVSQLEQKLSYFDGCRSVKDFVTSIGE